MSIKSIFRVIFGSYLVCMFGLASLAGLLVYNHKKLIELQSHRLDTLRFFADTQKTADYLTSYAKNFVQTGDGRFVSIYRDVKRMRDGKAPRPVPIDETYWDIQLHDKQPASALREPISNRAFIRGLSLADNELRIFDRLEEIFGRLNEIEASVMESLDPKSLPNRSIPLEKTPIISQLYSGEYMEIRLQMRQLFATLMQSFNARATQEISSIEIRSWWLLYACVALLCLLCATTVVAYRIILARVVGPIGRIKAQTKNLADDFESLVQTTRTIASGKLEAKFVSRTEQLPETTTDEIGQLVNIHNGMLRRMQESGSLIASVAADLRRSHEAAHSADRAKSEFLANLTHEIRTPMNAIIGFSELLTSKVNDPVLRGWTEGLRISSKNLLQLINDILDLSKIESGFLGLQAQPFNLHGFVAELQHIFSVQARDKRIEISFQIEPSLPMQVELDEGRFRQILVNLIGNAIKFTNEGQVTVSFHLIPLGSKDEAAFIVNVQDSGIGIDARDLNRIFDAFSQAEGQSTRKFGGTGLGLTISRRLTHMMGGSLTVESERGEGSTFTVSFPAVAIRPADPAATSKEETDIEDLAFEPATILIGEDSESNREVLRGFLQPYGFRILEALDGHDVLEKAVLHNPQLVLLDLQMPRLDGISVLKRLRADPGFADLPVIVLSASLLKGEMITIRQHANGFIRKPMPRAVLVRELMRFLQFSKVQPTIVKAKSSPFPSKLSGGARKQLFELVEPLDEELRNGLNLDHLEAIADRMKTIALGENDPSLEDFARNLQEAIEEIDAFRIKDLIHEIRTQVH